MDLGQFGRNRAAKGMPKKSQAIRADAKCCAQIIVCCLGIEFGCPVGWFSFKGHVAPIFAEHDGRSGAPFNRSCPIQLADGKVCVSVKTEQRSWSGIGISHDEAPEMLAICGLIVHAAGFLGISVKSRRLEENPLLGPPKKSYRTEDQRDYEKRRRHVGRFRGFQSLCMAGNLRQCEFP